MRLIDIKKHFDKRHDFDDSDLFLLKEKHKSVNIVNIPTAWIIPIDKLLCRFASNQVIKEVSQQFGQLIVVFKNIPQDQFNSYKKIIAEFEYIICNIDKDLKI